MLRRGMASIRRDPVFLGITAAVALLLAASFFLPLTADRRQWLSDWSDFPLLGAVILASWQAFRREPTPAGRRFWRLVTWSLGSWFAVLVLWEVPSREFWRVPSEVVSDYLFLIYYLGLFAATATRPHERRDLGAPSSIESTELAGAAVLSFGLLAYFVVLPSRITPEAYATFVPSLSLYVLLDVVLVARLAWWCRTTAGSTWRTTYAAFAAALTLTCLHDIHELRVYRAGMSLEPSAWDIVWWGQFVALTLAARLSVRQSATRSAEKPYGDSAAAATHRKAVMGPVVSYAFILPIVHLAGGVLGLLDPVLDHSRETLVLVCAVLLGGVAVLHHELTDRQYRLLRQNLHDAQLLLQQSRKMEALGRLAGGIAHTFNNLLSVIIGYSDLLAERLTSGDRLLEPVEQIRQAAERAATLTRQLAVFSRGQRGQEGVFDVDRALADLMPTIGRLVGDQVTVTIEPGAAGSQMQADPNQFDRAILNIAANARDAMPGGGVLRISTREIALTEGQSRQVGSLPPGRYVEIEVTDTGHGMNEDARGHVFEPFFTTRTGDGHRGLGLSIVYGVVRQVSGHIEVESVEGQGTTVRLYLPRVQARRAAEEKDGRVAESGQPLTVLVAEDERGLRRLMCTSLEQAGFNVLEAADGRAAVDAGEQYPGRIDLLVSDVVMPGCGGPEAARLLLAERPEMRVMFVSGYAPDTLGDLHVPGEEVVFLPKPFAMSELTARARATALGVPLDAGAATGDGGTSNI